MAIAYSAPEWIADDDLVVSDLKHGDVMIYKQTEFNDREGNAAIVQFGRGVEIAVFTLQAGRGVTLLERSAEEVWRRADGNAGMGENSNFAFFSRKTELSQRSDGSSGTAIVIGALFANAIAGHPGLERCEKTPVEGRSGKGPKGGEKNHEEHKANYQSAGAGSGQS